MIFLKFIHIIAISIWAAGLVSLPGLYVQRARIQLDEDLYRLQNVVRFSYVKVLSPAAFIAIGTGTALTFLQLPFSEWFSMKLALVGAMVVIHVMTGLVIIRLFDEGEAYPVWRFLLATIASTLIVGGILFMVLARPDAPAILPANWSEPGALKRMIAQISPWAIP
ncbi:hypothetical protein HGO38_13570 [Rhizobium sp. CG5]|uniref:CopD family protein n=1 Tax=Rhizobium sp. CG5 TaxID=2726076 RepID=UPI00203380DF|nr:CopD family protein [Rhizobium sp. CG5]MCM2474505.1 hypothetical protein [Rhizobium sp. CG5]